MQANDEHRYDDIIDMPRPVSRAHMSMSAGARAAQFAPFAALTGYDALIRETARLTEDWIEPDDDMRAALNAKLRILQEHLSQQPNVTISYFTPDQQKSGGTYQIARGAVRKVQAYERNIVMLDGTVVPMDAILDIDGDLFPNVIF